MITNAVVKAMYAVVNAYCMIVGTAMTWSETLMEEKPLTFAVIGALIINYFFL